MMMRKTALLVVLAMFLCVGQGRAENSEILQKMFAPFQPHSYVRPYGPNAPWNIPVPGIPRHPESDLWADRLWRLSTADRPGNFNLGGFEDYSYPVYTADEATTWVAVRSRHPDWGNLHGRSIPWNPNWRPAKGSDGQVIILDPATGREWNLWQVEFDGQTVVIGNGSLVDGDYRTKEDGFRPSRGCGIPYLAMLTRPEEIMQGAIRHALSMPIKNPNRNVFVPPATKTDAPRSGPADGVPMGMRFALNVTDEDIERWIGGLPPQLGDTTRYSARVIAKALREYGWFVTDTSGGAFFQFEYNGTAGEKWKALGLDKRLIGGKEYPRDLLDGLLAQERIYALVPSDQYPQSVSRQRISRAEPSPAAGADRPRR
ncbi:MAG: hypothetical protein N3D11_02330 [Candidatus Sumerlaeia bacterium]|nr:hypothetical protein [Candidatus Sumerlaeia bacterium]